LGGGGQTGYKLPQKDNQKDQIANHLPIMGAGISCSLHTLTSPQPPIKKI
jgi:hypothetical protein